MNDAVSLLQVIATTGGIVSLVVGAATVYLRLFVAKETADMRDQILTKMDSSFARKDELEDIRRRLDRLENEE